jgi:hypothetical protein
VKRFLFLTSLIVSTFCVVWGQYAPAVGEPGSTAIFKDDPSFQGWAKTCTVKRGFINISDTFLTYTQEQITSNHAFFGSEDMANGTPKGALDVVSLGDGGSAILTFDFPIRNGNGSDFAVFENGLKMQEAPFQYFLELAFVEVSTDGKRFVRFPAVSNSPIDIQIGSFGQIDPAKINNLAGKYVSNYGTPFDLEELKDSSGINIDSINYVKITDVVGDISSKYASHDSKGQIINDPFPTEFWSGGFDLDAVGVLYFNELTGTKIAQKYSKVNLFPNPIKSGGTFFVDAHTLKDNVEYLNLALWTIGGRQIQTWDHVPVELSCLSMPVIPSGIYFLKIQYSGSTITIKTRVE